VLVPANTKLLAAASREQHHEVQIKLFTKTAPQRIIAAAFDPIVKNLETAALPNYLLISDDTPRSVVLVA
jgi:hypothetical protein